MSTLTKSNRMTTIAALMMQAAQKPIARHTVLSKVYGLSNKVLQLTENGKYDAWGYVKIRHLTIRIDINGMDDMYTLYTPTRTIKTRSRLHVIDTIYKTLRG